MKLLVVATLGAFASSLPCGNATAATPHELLQSCQVVIKSTGTTQSTTIDIPVAGLPCWYYMAAVQNMSVVVDEHGRHLLGVCAPEDTTLMRYVRIFVHYAQRHSREATSNPAALALRALLDAFPCGARRPS